MLQIDFLEAILKECKKNGVHTAVDTAGHMPFECFEQIIPYTDLFLYDIKCFDNEKHKKYVGVENELILENARKIAESGADLTIRVPVIPTFNNTPDEIRDIAKFVKTLPNVKNMHLLPYHRMGEDKYKGLGREYLLENITPPTDEKMNELLKVAEGYGLKAKIGG